MISLPRETVAQLVAAGHGVLPHLIVHGQDTAAWALSEALRAAETALLDDDRAEDGGVID